MGVRHANEGDLTAILAITNEAIANTTALWTLTPATLESRRAWMRERQNRGCPVLVVEDEQGVRGFASYGQFRPNEGYLHSMEVSLYVHPSAQRRGYGRALLDALTEHAVAAGKHVLVAGIEASNTASITLHQRAGFREAGRLPHVGRKFGRWLDLVFMQKILPDPLDQS